MELDLFLILFYVAAMQVAMLIILIVVLLKRNVKDKTKAEVPPPQPTQKLRLSPKQVCDLYGKWKDLPPEVQTCFTEFMKSRVEVKQ
jgi:hypothetical protein